MIAALEDGPVQVSDSVANNEIFKAYARHNRVNSYDRQKRVNSFKGNYRNKSYVRNQQWEAMGNNLRRNRATGKNEHFVSD